MSEDKTEDAVTEEPLDEQGEVEEVEGEPNDDDKDEEKEEEEEEEEVKKDDEEEEEELINIRIPTQTKKSLKRKHIRTDFNAADMDADVSEAQRLEKQRLERLEKIKPDNDHIQQMESLFLAGAGESTQLPQLDLDDDDFEQMFGFSVETDNKRFRGDYEEQKPEAVFHQQQPSTSRGIVDVVDLTLDDSDDDCMITDIRSVAPQQIPGRRMRWAQAEKDRKDADQMEFQHSIEARRLKKMRSAKDLESTEKKGGRLLVNAGHPEEDPDIFVIGHLTHVLQPHQLGGIRFMYDNTIESLGEYKKSDGFGCILAHSMGLGKTIQVITFSEIFLRATKAKKVLVIVPINTIQNWYAEYDKWIPKFSDTGDRIRNFEVFLLGDAVKSFDQRVNLIEQWDQKGGVLLIGYDMFRLLIKMTVPKKAKKGRPKLNLSGVSAGLSRDQFEDSKDEEIEFETGYTNGGRIRQEAFSLLRSALLEPGPDLVVCDEGHKIKNITAEISTTLGAINTKRRIVLTGYPLQNNLMEYFCMIDFVRPKYLGIRKSFIERFEKPIKNGQCVDSSPEDVKIALQRTHVLVELVKGFVQRRTHHLLKKILPESKEYVLLLRKSQVQRQLYRNFVLWAKNEIAVNNDTVFNPLMAFSACSKIWNHPDILFRVVEQKRKAEDEKKRVEFMKLQVQQHQQHQQQMMQQQQHGMMMMMSQNGMMPGFGAQFHPQHSNGMNGMIMQNGSWPPNNYHINSPFASVSSNPSTPSTSAGTPTKAGKKQRKTKSSKKSAAKSDEEEEVEEKESRMRYDWTFQLFETYQEGVLENGYKIVVALEILDESTCIGEKILIFSQNLTALDMLEEILRKRQINGKNGPGERWEKNRNYLRLDGTTSGADREKLINRFNSEPGLHLFLISTRAGSLGINLVSANRCIIIDACWNPCHDAQAVCRVYRYGQQKKTFVYRLIMDNSMERSIFNRQISKHGLQQRVVDDAQVDANISQKELETLLMYDEAQDVKNDTWNTDDWDFGDHVLESITKKMSHLFSQKPFLHETLIMESEQSLSEQEKREAQLLFERERRMENYDPMSGMNNPNFYNNVPGTSMGIMGPPPVPMFNNSYNNQWNNQIPFQPQPPYPMQSFSPQQMPNPSFQPIPLQHQSPDPHMMPNPAMRPTPLPHTLRMNVSQFHQPGGHTMTSYNNGYSNNNNSMGPQQMLAPIDPTAFPGASTSKKPNVTNAGIVQSLVTDRALVFPVVGQREQLRSVPVNTPIQLIIPKKGFYVKLSDGSILDAIGSVFENHAQQLRNVYLNKNTNPDPFLAQEVIDLD
ncbi:CRE-RAD-26 protein [Caenorhabditis remanei]|uniref:CRE-RAD-26 protein n=1 Tax=Caenorhabditis remanei TaxID=31234 RepID=E3N5N9_CAERE|nr:CRE-RAD-26 protein [Caenorhabditis remanei]